MVSSTKAISFLVIALELLTVEGSIRGLVPAGQSPNLRPIHLTLYKRAEGCSPRNSSTICLVTGNTLYTPLRVDLAIMFMPSSEGIDDAMMLSYGEVYDATGNMVNTTSYAAGKLVRNDVYMSRKRKPYRVTQELTIGLDPKNPVENDNKYDYPLMMKATVESPDNNNTFAFQEVWSQSMKSTTISFSKRFTTFDEKVTYTFVVNFRVMVQGMRYRFFAQYGFDVFDRKTNDHINNITTWKNTYWSK